MMTRKIAISIGLALAAALALTACTVTLKPGAGGSDPANTPTLAVTPVTETPVSSAKQPDTPTASATATQSPEISTAQPIPAGTLWIDENSPANSAAVFHVGMSQKDADTAIEANQLEVINVWDGEDSKGYDVGPFCVSVGIEGLRYVQMFFDDENEYVSANGFNAQSTVLDVEKLMGRPLAAAAQDDSIIYLYERGGYYAEIYMYIEKPFKLYLISLNADVTGHIASPEFDEYDTIHDFVTGKTETIVSPFDPVSDGAELLYFADADGVTSGHFNGVVQKGRFYHDGREIWIGFYYIAVGSKQYAELAGLPYVQHYDEPKEVQLYSNTIDMEQYVGKHIVFNYSQCFEAQTIYHQRDYVAEVTEIIKTVD